jgi:cell division protein FtsW
MKAGPSDKVLFGLVIILVIGGFLIFSSAALGLLPRGGASFSSVALSQFLFGIVGGGTALFLMSNLHYRHLRKYAFYIFILACIFTLLVFVPSLGMTHGGATRWLSFGSFTIQPTELLKIAFIIYLATWLSGTYTNITNFTQGTLPFVGIVAIVGIITLLQPDTDTFLIMGAASLAMFIVAGGRWRDVFLLIMSAILLLALLAFLRPYVLDRLTTFINPESDLQGSGWQIHQSLIAVSTGGITGRGFGQSIQKFEYLPEPIGDSIFAVFAEEFGLLGSGLLILLYIGFILRGYRIANRANDMFGTLLVVGFITLIACQAFLNIASMIGVAPLSGLPLPFISHGGTALLATLTMVGIILNVSKYPKKHKRA